MYSLIIVDYNSIIKTVEYIDRCMDAMGSEGVSHVVIVQNGDASSDKAVLTDRFGEPKQRFLEAPQKNVLVFEKENQTVVYCPAGENLGYAKGNNLAAVIAAEFWGDPYYIISNNDLEFPEKLDLQISDKLFREDPQIGAIGPQVVTPQGDIQSPRYWIGPGKKLIASYWINCLSGLFGERFRNKMYNKFGRDIVFDAASGYYAWISGCFMILRAKAFHEAGMFDENTFLYAEEPILAKRLEQIQSRVYFCRELKVIHAHGATTTNNLKMMRMITIDFESNQYLYKTYMHTSSFVLACSKVSFRLYKWMVGAKSRLTGRA